MNVKGSMLSQLPASSGCTNAQMIAGTTWSTRLGLNVTDPESSRNLSSHRWYFLGPFQLLGLVNVYTLRTWKWPIIVDLPKKKRWFSRVMYRLPECILSHFTTSVPDPSEMPSWAARRSFPRRSRSWCHDSWHPRRQWSFHGLVTMRWTKGVKNGG